MVSMVQLFALNLTMNPIISYLVGLGLG